MQHELNVQDYLKQEVDHSKTLLKELRKKTTPDVNHKLRVSIRRIRTVLQLLQNDQQKPLNKNDIKSLKKIWKHLGKVRDFDVSEEIAETNELPVRAIQTQRKNADAKLQKDSVKTNAKKLLNHLRKLSKSEALEHVHPEPTIESLRKNIEELPLNLENMHAFRIIMKKVRYLMEAFKIEDAEFKKYQDILGELNDLKVFLDNQGESSKVRNAYKSQLNKALTILEPAKNLALESLNKAEKNLL
jgi:CHAD domain-containing protein